MNQIKIEDLLSSQYEYICESIKDDFSYVTMTDEEKESFLSKIKTLLETKTINANDPDAIMIVPLVTYLLREINQEFEIIFKDE